MFNKDHCSVKPGRGRHAFTLIELLVMIAVAGVFIVVFSSALSRAGEQDELLACRNNLRSVYEAAMQYVNDFEAICHGEWEFSYMRLLTGTMDTSRDLDYDFHTSYLRPTSRAFFCPLRSDEIPPWNPFRIPPTLPRWTYWNAGYPINIANCGNNWRSFAEMRTLRGTTVNISVLRPHRAANPSNHWFFTESHNSSSRLPNASLDLHHQAGTGPGSFRAVAIHLLHSGTANMSFLDGHLESVDTSRLKSVEPAAFGQFFDEDRILHKFPDF